MITASRLQKKPHQTTHNIIIILISHAYIQRNCRYNRLIWNRDVHDQFVVTWGGTLSNNYLNKLKLQATSIRGLATHAIRTFATLLKLFR